jgi:peptidoglycan-associated lipoprotein
MKVLKFLNISALSIALAFTAVGCKHKQPPVTRFGSGNAGLNGSEGPGSSGTLDGEGLKGAPMGGGPTANFNPDDMTQDRTAFAADTVYFDFDSAAIRGTEESKIAAVASALKSDSSADLLIEGHCDERGTEEYNRALGEKRALAAREALANQGVDASRVATRSYGQDRPADPGHNESAWRRNRRDEFVLLHPK